MPSDALILGGARSGKSAYAEALTLSMAAGLSPRAPVAIYLATAEALDQEMSERIEIHRRRRGATWRLVEAPRSAPEELLRQAAPDRVVLVDCLTLWLSNMMLADIDLEQATTRMLEAMAAASGPVISVSSEVGLGVTPENALARRFRDAQGQLNQRVAAASRRVAFLAAGLPMALKGEFPS